jgi:hypothetical protein
MRMKLYAHMNDKPKERPSIYRRIINRLRPPKPKPKPKLQNLPKELLEEIAKKLRKNLNVQSLAIGFQQLHNGLVHLQKWKIQVLSKFNHTTLDGKSPSVIIHGIISICYSFDPVKIYT